MSARPQSPRTQSPEDCSGAGWFLRWLPLTTERHGPIQTKPLTPWVWVACLYCLACLLAGATESWAAASGSVYIVQRGDTMSGIAHSQGITLAQLLSSNKLNTKDRIRPGQRLVIPASTRTPSHEARAPSAKELPTAVREAIDEATVKPGRWKYIVIHHSGVNTGTLAGMDRYHREVRHMENGLAYHFVIGNDHGLGDGQIGVGSRWTKQLDGGHLISDDQNRVSLGICLVGNFDETEPTERQLARLTALVRALMVRCRLKPEAIKTHQQINVVHTRCPGRRFPLKSWLRSLD